jgi:hypothetical protein
MISDLLGQILGKDFDLIARFCVVNKRHNTTNIISLAVLWSMWKLRNEIYFQGVSWIGMQKVLLRIVGLLRRWMALFKQDIGMQVEEFA